MKTHREFKQRGLTNMSAAFPENCLRDLAEVAKPVIAKVGYRLGRWFATIKMAVITAEGRPTRLASVPRIGVMKSGRPFLTFKKEVPLSTEYLRPGEGYEYLLAVISPMGVALFRLNMDGKFIGDAPPSVQQILRGEAAVQSPHSQLHRMRFVGPKQNLAALEAFLAISYGAVCADEENSLEVTVQALRYLPWETANEKVGKVSEWEAIQRSAQCLGEVDPCATKVAERLIAISTNMGGYEPSDLHEDVRGNVQPGGTCGMPAEQHLTEVDCLAAADMQADAMKAAWEEKRARDAAGKQKAQKTAPAATPMATAAPAAPLTDEAPAAPAPIAEPAPAASLVDEVPTDLDALEAEAMSPAPTGEEKPA